MIERNNMPHSSGGGSSSGGSHSGSSSSSSSSSSNSSSGSGSNMRRSHTYFSGARRFVGYRNGIEDIVYSNYDITKPVSKLRYLLLLFYAPFFLFGIAFLRSAIDIPHKLDLPEKAEVEIVDSQGVFSETSRLKESLEAFQEQTGITTAIYTTNADEWTSNFASLERFAYSTYVNNYPDERHFVLVYSNDDDWSWEGMQGDETDGILTSEVTNTMNEHLMYYFYRNDYTVENAIAEVFDELTPNIMDARIDKTSLIVVGCILAFVTVHMFFCVFYNPNKKYRDYVEEANPRVSNMEQEEDSRDNDSVF